nr:hypothetical protein [Tanacetum cinerariifolium]
MAARVVVACGGGCRGGDGGDGMEMMTREVVWDDDGEEATVVRDGVDEGGVRVEPRWMRWFKRRLSRVAVEMMMLA